MLPPIIVIWVTLRLLMPAADPPTVDLARYDGPLAERQVQGIDPRHGTSFTIDADSPRLRAFESRLRQRPIYVRAPGEKYLVFGLKTWTDDRGEIFVVALNTLLDPSEQPLGPWLPDGGEMLRWAFSVMDHYDLGYDPERQLHQKTRQQLIDWYHSDSVPVDWEAVAERLRSTGRPVPDDLFDDHP